MIKHVVTLLLFYYQWSGAFHESFLSKTNIPQFYFNPTDTEEAHLRLI